MTRHAWDPAELRALVLEGLHDREIAQRLGTTPKAVEMARYREGLRSHRRCTACQRVFEVPEGRTRKLAHCSDCLEIDLAQYLAGQLRVEVLEKTLGVGRTTLVVEARKAFGITRQDVTPGIRAKIREVLRDTKEEPGEVGTVTETYEETDLDGK